MKTSYYHEPVLTYKETFYEKDGTNKLNIHNGSKSQYQWVLQGKIEDILWTIGTLKSKVRDIGVYTESACIKNLPAILGSRYRKIWDNLEKRRASAGDPALDTLTFKEVITELLEDIEEVESYWLAVFKLSNYFNDRIVTCTPQLNPRCGSQRSTCSWSVRQPVHLYVPVYCSYHHTLASASFLCLFFWVAFVVGFCCSILNISNTMCGLRNYFRVFQWCFAGWCFVQ